DPKKPKVGCNIPLAYLPESLPMWLAQVVQPCKAGGTPKSYRSRPNDGCALPGETLRSGRQPRRNNEFLRNKRYRNGEHGPTHGSSPPPNGPTLRLTRSSQS